MLLAAIPLARDSHTEGDSFGYERSLWPDGTRPYQHHTPRLGCPIGIETKLTRRLVKLVELHRRQGMFVVAERLAWRFGDSLYPFRVKYVRETADARCEEPLLFLSNMGAIHRKLTHLDISFSSPVRFYLENVFLASLENVISRDYVTGICNEHRLTIDDTATQETDRLALRDFLTCLDTDYPYGFEKFVLPKFTIDDPVSRLFHSEPMRARNMLLIGTGNNPFNTAPAAPIEISHPEVTIYSRKAFHDVAMLCELVSSCYTDVKLEYILSERGIMEYALHHAVSRYFERTRLDLVAVRHHCTTIAVDVVSIATSQHPEWRTRYRGLFVTVEITYGDEALISVNTTDRVCLFAVHLDLAMISLCASGVIAQVM